MGLLERRVKLATLQVCELINDNGLHLKLVNEILIDYSLKSEYGLKSLILGTFGDYLSRYDACILLVYGLKNPIVIKGFVDFHPTVIDDDIWIHVFRAALLSNGLLFYVIHYVEQISPLKYVNTFSRLEKGFTSLGLILQDYLLVADNKICSMRAKYGKRDN